VTYNARGYPPSDVPKDGERYSQERARDDIRAVLDALEIDKAMWCGLSMGGFATLHFGFAYRTVPASLVVGGCGYGRRRTSASISPRKPKPPPPSFEQLGMAKAAVGYGSGRPRVQFQNKDRAAGRNSSTSWLSIRRRRRKHHAWRAKAPGRRCSTLSTR